MRTLLAASLAFFPLLTAPAQQIDHRNGKTEMPRATAGQQKSDKGNSCAKYGAGFLQVPGTKTCIRIGGSISIEGRVH
ncbi:MAG TPA: porin [Rhizomicrobium sp.]|jgi:hypothetical protein|nr:porin [Rhizomicrobium sp.]